MKTACPTAIWSVFSPRAGHRRPADAGFPGMRYALIHTFSHALMRQRALESGYSAASIRERIYCDDGHADAEPMAGLLLYTAAPDSEGTLGGLVSQGEPSRLGRLIRLALDSMELCSSDPAMLL